VLPCCLHAIGKWARKGAFSVRGKFLSALGRRRAGKLAVART